MPFSTGATDRPLPSASAAVGWQERALARSLAERRARSVERLASFVAATRELAAETGSSSFTVHQVVERSGQSLKSFYRYFEGKDDLLLALLEEDIGVGAVFLAEMVDRAGRPEARLRAWVEGLFELLAAGEQGYVAVLVREHRRLAEAHPARMEATLAPFLDLLTGALAEAAAAGVVRAGDARRDARTVFDLVLAQIHQLVLSPGVAAPPAGRGAGSPSPGGAVVAEVVDPAHASRVAETAAYTWAFCWGGLAAPPAVRSRAPRAKGSRG